MRYIIPCINSALNLDRYTIGQYYEVPKCDNLWYSSGLVIWFQVGQTVFCYSQKFHGGLNMLTKFYLNVSCGEGLKSNFLVAVNYPTILLDVWGRLHRYM